MAILPDRSNLGAETPNPLVTILKIQKEALELENTKLREAIRDAVRTLSAALGKDAPLKPHEKEALFKRSVHTIPWCVRVKKVCTRLGVENIHDLVQKTERDFLEMPNFGQHSLRDLNFYLTNLDERLHLGMTEQEITDL